MRRDSGALIHLLQPIHVSATFVKAGEAAARLAANKRNKYEEITHTHLFYPIAVETMGPVEDQGSDLLSAIDRSSHHKDNR